MTAVGAPSTAGGGVAIEVFIVIAAAGRWPDWRARARAPAHTTQHTSAPIGKSDVVSSSVALDASDGVVVAAADGDGVSSLLDNDDDDDDAAADADIGDDVSNVPVFVDDGNDVSLDCIVVDALTSIEPATVVDVSVADVDIRCYFQVIGHAT